MHADDVLFEVVPSRPNLCLILAIWRGALEAGSDGIYANTVFAFLVSLQVVYCAEAINAGAALDITFVWLVVFQHMLPFT